MRVCFAVRSVGTLALLLLLACGSSGGGSSPDGGGDTNNNNTGPLVLATGFQLAARTGSTTGTMPRSTCTGFFPAQPNFLMTLQNTFTGVAVSVTSVDSISLAISFGASSFCGDGAPPTVTRGSWSAGEYQIFVGTATQDATSSFALTVTE